MSDKGLISKIDKELIQLNIKKTPNNLIKNWAEFLNRQFSKEDIQMANRHMKICSTSLLTIKSKPQWDITSYLSEWPLLKRQQISSWRERGEKETQVHCWWECKLVQLLWKTVWRFLRKFKVELPYAPAIPLLGIYPKKTNSLIRKDTCIPCSLQHYLR